MSGPTRSSTQSLASQLSRDKVVSRLGPGHLHIVPEAGRRGPGHGPSTRFLPGSPPRYRIGLGIRARNKTENTIAPFCVTTYHGFMTTWQTLKRAGYMHPYSSLEAALFSNRCGVVAV